MNYQPRDTYQPPFPLFNGHLQTIVPALLRNPTWQIPAQRERIPTPDDDFLDLDWVKHDGSRLVILSHGLEGDSNRPYMRGMARAFYQNGYDVLAWNFRGCSGEMNRKLRMYHSGATDDLLTVLSHASQSYSELYLVGFSLGGNLTLKFLGEYPDRKEIRKVIVFSTPLDLKSGAVNLTTRKNHFYEQRFLRSLRAKITAKHRQFPDHIDLTQLKRINHVIDFDDIFTSRLHGFQDADDYYSQCSSRNFLDAIRTPTLIVNAQNDSFLTPDILDSAHGQRNDYVHYLITKMGGHCGFPQAGKLYWSEQCAVDFFKS